MHFGIWTNKVFCREIINLMIVYPDIPVWIEDAGGGILTHQNLIEELAIVNQELKEQGKPPISASRIRLFTPSKKISKNQKLDYTTAYWKNHQIRFRVGANGIEQVKKECKAFHPDKDSKEGKSYYRVLVKTDKNFLERKGKKLPIIPGMITSVDIITGKKSILDFILKPILKVKQESLHER